MARPKPKPPKRFMIRALNALFSLSSVSSIADQEERTERGNFPEEVAKADCWIRRCRTSPPKTGTSRKKNGALLSAISLWCGENPSYNQRVYGDQAADANDQHHNQGQFIQVHPLATSMWWATPSSNQTISGTCAATSSEAKYFLYLMPRANSKMPSRSPPPSSNC